MTKKIPCEVFSRVVGYYRPLHNWNDGKAEEHKNRMFFGVQSMNSQVPEMQESSAVMDPEVNPEVKVV